MSALDNHSPESFGYNQQLNRKLNTWQLTTFGLNYMIPLSPAIFFGFVLAQSGGTVALPFIIGGIAVFFTALSYATMVRHFPLAGSIYNFLAFVWNKRIGFIAGWILLLDYLLITSVTSMSAAVYVTHLISAPYWLVLLLFVAVTGIINILGIEIVAWVGLILLLIAEFVVIASFIVWSHAIIHRVGHFSALFSWQPFHFENLHMLMNATSLAIASYLGFDAITTLSEEAHHPTKSIPKAIYWCVCIGGLGMVLTGYLGVLACPHWPAFISQPGWQETALFYVAQETGGPRFALFYSLGFILSMLVFNIVAMAASARLLFGIGRDRLIQPKIFASLHLRWKTPYLNIFLIMLISFFVGAFANIDTIASLVNYGALLGFACLNLSVIGLYVKRDYPLLHSKPSTQVFYYVIFPLLGFFIVSWVFISLNAKTLIIGSCWLCLGFLYLLLNRRFISQR